jgi:hypothetical protein
MGVQLIFLWDGISESVLWTFGLPVSKYIEVSYSSVWGFSFLKIQFWVSLKFHNFICSLKQCTLLSIINAACSPLLYCPNVQIPLPKRIFYNFNLEILWTKLHFKLLFKNHSICKIKKKWYDLLICVILTLIWNDTTQAGKSTHLPQYYITVYNFMLLVLCLEKSWYFSYGGENFLLNFCATFD